MNIYPFSVGPIVGSITHTSLRLWGRGLEAVEETDSTPYLGIARLRASGHEDYGSPTVFPLRPDQDHTGTAEFNELTPNTSYQYQIGWLPTNTLPSEVDWHSAHQGEIKTASPDPTEPRTFVFGSCRYLLRIKQGFFFNHVGDRTFQQIFQTTPIDRFLMLGDQIYADDFGAISPDQSLKEFNRRYREAFSQPHLRALMASTPTAMMLDDHEITNNWPLNAQTKTEESPENPLYQNAMQAFYNYQLSHSPAFTPSPRDPKPKQHWYQFQDGCCDFFITDTRTERNLSAGKIMSDRQMTAIQNWLMNDRDRVKILASSVLIFPDSGQFNPDSATPCPRKSGLNQDQWCGFRTQQIDLLHFIHINQIRRVVFISGDVHASFSAKLTHPDDPDFQVLSIVSSPFFWPVRHGKAENFQLRGQLGNSPYEVTPLKDDSPVMSHDNFTQVRITPSAVQIKITPRQDKLLFWRRPPNIEQDYVFRMP